MGYRNKQILSIVIPVYNEAGNIIPLYDEIKTVLDNYFKKFKYEIIIVDDGSNDNTWNDILECKKLDKNVIGISLNKNYGQSIALDAGFKKLKGDIIITMDGDRQNNPEDIKQLYDKLVEYDYDIVTGWRHKRLDPIWMIIVTNIAKFLIRILIKDGVRDSGCTLRIYKRKVIENIYLWAEMHRFLIAIAKVKGFKIGEVKVQHRPRILSKSKYNIQKSVKGFIDIFYVWFISKYESRPLHIFGFVGIIDSILGILFFSHAVFEKIFYGNDFTDNGSTIIAFFLLNIGVFLFIFGIIIDIQIRNYYNTSKDNRYIIRKEV